MPAFLFEKKFIHKICHLLNPKAFVLLNTMMLSKKQKQLNLDFTNNFDSKLYTVTKMNKIEKTNELILIESKF